MITIHTRTPSRINLDTPEPSVIHGATQVAINGIDPPFAFRCGGHVYVKSELYHVNTLCDREWETGLIDGRDQ